MDEKKSSEYIDGFSFVRESHFLVVNSSEISNIRALEKGNL